MLKRLAPLTAIVFVASSAVAFATTLHPGDKVAVNVYNHPELAVVSTTVDSSGRISVPLAGLVTAGNQSPRQVAALITEKLVAYVRRPAVDVQLLSQGQNIFVTGGPGGVFPYTPGETLTGALSQIQTGLAAPAGGTAPANANPTLVSARNFQYGSVDLNRVVIKRDGRELPPIDARQLIATGNPGPDLQPGDTVELVNKPIAVAVRGDVTEPGVAHLDPQEPLSNALLQVGGPNSTTSSVAFVLNRNNKDTMVTSSSPEYRQPPQQGDSIYVPRAERIGVVGQVVKPGDVVLSGDKSLLSALYYAGGPTKWGDIRNVVVVHQGTQKSYDVTKLTHGAPDQNPTLSDGDTLFVPEGHKIDFSVIFAGIFAATNLSRL